MRTLGEHSSVLFRGVRPVLLACASLALLVHCSSEGHGGGGAGGSAGRASGGSGGDAGTNSVAGTSQGDGAGNGGSSVGPEAGGDLKIPSTHPRLWWTPERLEQARAWYATHEFSPHEVSEAVHAIDAAFHYVVSGKRESARAAIDWALDVQFGTDGVASDGARWNGEGVILVYDWCFDVLTADERATLLERWNNYISVLNAKDWGGVGMEGNNYYIGYTRNTLEWAIATHGENGSAAEFLNYALETRWKSSYIPYANEHGRGGIMHEGSAYGRRVLGYWTVPLTSADLLGRNMWDETPFFRESIYWLIYSTTPGITHQKSDQEVHDLYETYPFNEDERWLQRDPRTNTAQTTLGDYLTPLVSHWAKLPIAGYAQQFIEQTGATPTSRFVQAVATAVTPRPFSELPLDYYTSGLGMAYAKSAWSGAATALNAQVSVPVGVGHSHLDAGSFQLWRGGEWLSRETVGYADQIVGYNAAQVDCREPVGHNVLLYNGKGTIDHFHHRPQAVRLASTNDYFYLAMDLTGGYETAEDWSHREEEVGNPSAGHTVRELVFVRPLETLVVFDRMEASGSNASSVKKTFLVHFPSAPSFDGRASYVGTSGSQALRVTTALPNSVSRRVVAEGGAVGQHRVEIETSGQVVSHFLHVLQARAANVADLQISTKDTGSADELTLTHPTLGQAVISFERGIQSVGGSFGFARSGTPKSEPLRADVQSLAIDYDGVRWNP